MVKQKGNVKGRKVKSTRTSRKKKKWFDVVAPKMFNSMKVGETLANEAEHIVGRKLRINMMVLANDPRRQNTSVNFKVVSINNNAGVCKTIGYELNKSNMKRVIRKGTTKIEDSFVTKSKDGAEFRVKPLVVTRFKVNNSVSTEIRKTIRDFVAESFGKFSEEEVFSCVLQTKLQREIRDVVKKVYPLASCEIRCLELVSKN